MISILRFLLAAHLSSSLAGGDPTISFPFNAQLPPVARAGSLYSYAFSHHTFTSDTNITYALGTHPDWLSLEPEERRLFGIPDVAVVPLGDELVGQLFEIIATDASGSVTMESTIVVSRDDGPSVKTPISQQIGRFGDYSAPSSIISYPSTDFSYPFDKDTFRHDPGMVNYYASSSDSSPLPAWIRFDAKRLTFSGTTPPAEALYQPPQRFDVRLVASDIEGFSSSSLEFSIVVGSHKLYTDTPVVELNASRGQFLEHDGLAEGIHLDDRTVTPGTLNVTTTSLPPWLSFDPDTWVIEGTPKEDDHSSNFTVQFTDVYADALEVLVKVKVATGLFETTFDEVEATPGEDFSLDLAQHFRDPDDIQVSIRTDPEQDWLSLNGLRIQGTVPKSANGATQIFIEATSKSSGTQETEALQITYLAPNGKTTISPTSSSSAFDAPRETDDEPSDDNESKADTGGIGTGTILLATIVPVIAIALLIMLLVCCLRRRRTRRTRLTQRKLRTKISDPIIGSLRVNGSVEPVERPMTIDGSETYAFRSEKPAPAVMAPSRHTSRTSDTLGSYSSQDSAYEYRMHNARDGMRPTTSSGETDGAQSWYTVERTPTALRSERSTKSRGSDVTLPLSTHQLLPTPPFLARAGDGSFRGGLELNIPGLGEVPSLPLLTDPAEDMYDRSTGLYSTFTSSSAALPSSRRNSFRAEAAAGALVAANTAPSDTATRPSTSRSHKAMTKGASGSDNDWSTMHGSDFGHKVPEIPLPSDVRLSSQEWAGHQKGDGSWLGNSPISGLRSLMTETSFGSSENWRIVGNQQRNEASLSMVYKNLVGEPPFSPASPAKGGPGPSGLAPRASTESYRGASPLDQSRGRARPSTMTPTSSTSSVNEVGGRARPSTMTPGPGAEQQHGEGSPSGQPPRWVRPKASRSRFSRLNADEKLGSGGPPNWTKEDSTTTRTSEGSHPMFI